MAEGRGSAYDAFDEIITIEDSLFDAPGYGVTRLSRHRQIHFEWIGGQTESNSSLLTFSKQS